MSDRETSAEHATSFLIELLRGSGQILFQPSARTGAVFLLLILWQSPIAAGACLSGLLGATLSARFLERSSTACADGSGGFNGALLGLALCAFVAESWMLLPLALSGGALTAILRAGILRFSTIPPFTAPYVLLGWGMLPVCLRWLGEGTSDVVPSAPQAIATLTNSAQVLFLVSPWVGLLVIAAVALHSRTAAIWVAAASVLAWLTAWAGGMPHEWVAGGYSGYNAMILAAALHSKQTPLVPAVGGVMASVWLSWLCLQWGVIALSAPFLIAAWLTVLLTPGRGSKATSQSAS